MRLTTLFAAWLMAGGIPTAALGDNLSANAAYPFMPGGTPAEAVVSDTTERWYKFGAVERRSYCVETQGGVHFDTAASIIDTRVEVFRGEYGPVLAASYQSQSDEPNGLNLARVCWIMPIWDSSIYSPGTNYAPETAYVKVRGVVQGVTFNVRVRVVETTLFSNWFFAGDSYNAFTLLRNTTYRAVPFTINWRNYAGNIVGTVSGSLPGNGSAFFNAADLPGAVAAQHGTVDIAHEGSPQAIVASTTVMSAATGLSFDAPFWQRASW